MAGQIHDLGYKRYAGARQDAGTRWRVIMRHQIATAWKTWWRFKAWLGAAVLVSFIAGAVMYIFSNRLFQGMGRVGQVALTVADAALPQSIAWYCRAAFLASLTLGAGVIAGDVQSGAFTFYFARSVRTREYVLGKLAGLGLLMAILTMVGPVVLAGMRLGLCHSWGDVVDHLVLFPKALAVGGLATLVYTAVPLGFSALADTRRTALAMWAAWYMIGGTVAIMVGAVSHVGWLAALDPHTAIDGVVRNLFGVSIIDPHLVTVSIAQGVTSIAAYVIVSIAIVWVSVDRAEKAGIGGAT